MKIGDDDARLLQLGDHLRRNDAALGVDEVVFRLLGLEHAQTIADGDPGRDDEKAVGVALRVRMPGGIDRLPGDEQRHDRGFARPGRHLGGDPEKAGIGGIVRLDDLVAKGLGGDLHQPDDRLDGLDLTEEERKLTHAAVAPPAQKALGFGRDAPFRWGQSPPRVDLRPDRGNQRVVAGLFRVIRQRALLGTPAAGGYRDDVAMRAPAVLGDARRLAVLIEVPVPLRRVVGRVEDRIAARAFCRNFREYATSTRCRGPGSDRPAPAAGSVFSGAWPALSRRGLRA